MNDVNMLIRENVMPSRDKTPFNQLKFCKTEFSRIQKIYININIKERSPIKYLRNPYFQNPIFLKLFFYIEGKLALKPNQVL